MILKRYRNVKEYNRANPIKRIDDVAVPEWQVACGLRVAHIYHHGKFLCGLKNLDAELREIPTDMLTWLKKLPTNKNPDLCKRCHVFYQRIQNGLP